MNNDILNEVIDISMYTSSESESEDSGPPPDAVDSPFTILVDSNEQLPFTFKNIIGDFRNPRTPITVKTRRSKLPVADYAIDKIPGICIERKSKADLFSSMANGEKRDNFIERLRKMHENYEFAAVVVECPQIAVLDSEHWHGAKARAIREAVEGIIRAELDFDDLRIAYDIPNEQVHTRLEPKSVIRSSFSWEQQFPYVHWYWGEDRGMAEQITYRLLEIFYRHKSDAGYKYHNKVIDSHLEAQKNGFLSREYSDGPCEIPYCQGNPLRVSWFKGYGFAATHFHEGDLGQLYEPGKVPSNPPTPQQNRKIKAEEAKFKPQPGDRVFIFDSIEQEAKTWIGQQFDLTVKPKIKKVKK